MMPDNDRLAIKSQGTKKDDGLYPPERSGVKYIVFFFTEQNLSGSVKHELQTAWEEFVSVHHGTYPVLFQQGESV